MLIGYARVSTDDQNLTLQLEALQACQCSKIFSDKLSANAAHRPGLAAALAQLRAGDTLLVWKLDRLGRSMRQLVDLMQHLHDSAVNFRSLTESIDTTTPGGMLYFHTIAAFAQMERELTIERTRAGLAAARARGRLGGRKRALSAKQIAKAKSYFAGGLGATEIARILGVSAATVYRAIPAEERQIEAFPDSDLT
jgi:DNA invertase Pin-like site-specific DNA recombinase